MHGAAFPISPSSTPVAFRSNSAVPSATASTAATIASWACPWNKFAKLTTLPDFEARGLEHNSLVELFMWSEQDFLSATEGSAIRRIGHARWLRNIATALGNALGVQLADSARQQIPRLRFRRALFIRMRWCVSTSSGRSPSRQIGRCMSHRTRQREPGRQGERGQHGAD